MIIRVLYFLARELNKIGWSKTQNNNNMKTAINKVGAALIGLSILVTSLAPSMAIAGPRNEDKKKNATVEGISNQEIENLLEVYKVEETSISSYKTVKIFDNNDNLIYSEEVYVCRFDEDARLLALLEQSDFLTEVDDVKYYKLDQ